MVQSLYTQLWSKFLEPRFETLRGKQLPQLVKEAEKTQYLSPPELENFQWAELALLLEHAYENVPFYQRFFKDHGLRVADVIADKNLSLLPIITREMLTSDLQDFTSTLPIQGAYKKATGGSTGAPVRFWVSPLSDSWRNAMSRRGYSWAGVINGKKVVYIWGTDIYEKTPLLKKKSALHNYLLRKKVFVNLDLRPERLDQLMALIDKFRPHNIVSFTSSVEILARYALQKSWRPSYPLESVIVGAEKLEEPQREVIEKALGCPVFESYGSREFMLIAMECEAHTGLHVSSENMMVEIIGPDGPCAPGQSGEVLITDLHNYATPFIRYKNGDMATWSKTSSCPCGRQLPMLESIDGRTLDIIRGVDGRPLTGAFFPHLMKEFEDVKQYQAVQTSRDSLLIRLVPQDSLPAAVEEEIVKQVQKVLPGMKISVALVDELEKTRTGKIRVAIGLKE